MSTEPSPSSLQVTIEELQCPFCEQAMFPPIFQCLHGHFVCSECNEIATNSCPLCTEKLLKIKYSVRCRFKSLGCEHIIPYKYISKHENRECKYRPYTCPFFSNHYCPITGDILQVFSHLKDDHMVYVYDGSFTVNYRQLNLPRHTIVINRFGKQFCWQFELFPENALTKSLVVTVQFIGEIKEAIQFGYSLEIKGSPRKLVSSKVCRSIRYSTEIEFPRCGTGLVLPSNASLYILQGNHSLEIK